jgi:serine/threonine protein kinase
VEQVGEGTYGQVYKARNKETGEIVALKRVRMDNEREGFPITAIREIKILKILNHKNIVCLKEIVTSKASEYNHGKGSIYMVMEFADHDLCGLTDAGIRFTEAQIKCYMKQLLEGLAYCHKNRILHRDIKGSNLLITNEGQLKLADFGLARPFDDNNRAYTNRVITLWYRCAPPPVPPAPGPSPLPPASHSPPSSPFGRPPELLLGAQQYGPAIDLWSVGCIFAEILNRKPILPGSNEFEQLSMIFQLMGTPDDKSWPGVSKLQHYSLFRQHQSNRTYASKFNERFGHLPESAQSLLSKLLAMNPEVRPPPHRRRCPTARTPPPPPPRHHPRLPSHPPPLLPTRTASRRRTRSTTTTSGRPPSPPALRSSRSTPSPPTSSPPRSGARRRRPTRSPPPPPPRPPPRRRRSRAARRRDTTRRRRTTPSSRRRATARPTRTTPGRRSTPTAAARPRRAARRAPARSTANAPATTHRRRAGKPRPLPPTHARAMPLPWRFPSASASVTRAGRRLPATATKAAAEGRRRTTRARTTAGRRRTTPTAAAAGRRRGTTRRRTARPTAARPTAAAAATAAAGRAEASGQDLRPCRPPSLSSRASSCTFSPAPNNEDNLPSAKKIR